MTNFRVSKTMLFRLSAGLGLSALVASPAAAQTYSEVEPNESRATATPIPALPTGPGLAPGETIGGISTANSTTAASPANSDYYRLRIDSAPLATYKQRLTATSGGPSQSYGVSIRGYSQGNDGTINTSSDAAVFSTTTTTPPRYIQWYGFGKGEFVNFRIDGVSGASGTTQPYTLTFTREAVVLQNATTTFGAGPITISSMTSGATTTDFWVYDANLDPVSTFGNDDNTVVGGGTGTGGLSIATRNLAPGTYYVAISTFNLANDQASPFDERPSTIKNVWSDPNGLSNNATSTNVNVSFHISDGTQTELVSATKVEVFDVVWTRFIVGAATNILVTPGVTPDPIVPGQNVTLTLDVTAAPTPPNIITSATYDLTSLGGPASAALFDDGAHADGAAGDGLYGLVFAVPLTASPGALVLPYSVSDNGGRTTDGAIPVNVSPVVPPNDDCVNARVITDAMLPFATSVGINLAGPDLAVSCSTSGVMNNGVWYTYTPSSNCILSMRETGARDALFAVYTGGCGFGSTEVFCEGAETDANFPLQAGTTYHILVGTPGSASTGANDAFAISFECGVPPAPPINDNCSGSLPLIPGPDFNTVQVGGATEDNFTSCITTFGVQGGRNGVWYTYSTGAQDQLARLYRANDGQFISAAIYTGPCIGAEVACLNLGTVSPGTGVPLRRNTTYSFLIHRRTGYAAADATFQFVFNAENYPNVDNGDCSTAAVVPGLPFAASVPNILAFDDGPLNDCPTATIGDAAGGSGVWYVYTPTQPTIVKVENLNSGTQNAAVAAFEGSCGGSRVMCSLTDTDTSGSNLFRARAGVPYYILITRQETGLPAGTATFEVSITGVPVPAAPSNDECTTATIIASLPFSETVSNAFANDEPFKAVCARGTITTTTRNSIWYRYTNGPGLAAAIMSESSGQDAMIAAYKGTCGALVPVVCTDDPESNNYLYMEPNTAYYILVAHAFDFPSQGTEVISFAMDVSPSLIAPPANDNCSTATRVRTFPFTSTALPLAANHDPDTSCSTANVAQATNGVWYAIPGYNGFTLSVTETASSPNVMYAVYQAACGGFEIGCQTTDTNRTFPLTTGDTYYLLVARESNSDYTLGATPPSLTITAAAGTSGACCTGTACVATTIESCTSGFVPNAGCDAGNPVACCPANFNQVGGVTVQDIFDFLAAYFSQSPSADFNASGTVTVQDIFDFLAAYFTAC